MDKVKLIAERTDPDTDLTFYDFRCPHLTGCGDPAAGRPFFSAGWLDRDHAVARGKQHLAEHETGEPMQELHEFRTERGLTQETAGQAATPEDWEF